MKYRKRLGMAGGVLAVALSASAASFTETVVISPGALAQAAGMPAGAKYNDASGPCEKQVDIATASEYPPYMSTQSITVYDNNQNPLAGKLSESVLGFNLMNGEMVSPLAGDFESGFKAIFGDEASAKLGTKEAFVSVNLSSTESIEMHIKAVPDGDTPDKYILEATVSHTRGDTTKINIGSDENQIMVSSRLETIGDAKVIPLSSITATHMSLEDFKASNLNSANPDATISILSPSANNPKDFQKSTAPSGTGINNVADVARNDGKNALGFKPCDNAYKDKKLPDTDRSSDSGYVNDSGYDFGGYSDYYVSVDYFAISSMVNSMIAAQMANEKNAKVEIGKLEVIGYI